MKLGEDMVAVRQLVEGATRDDYGNPITTKVDRLVRWCSMTPTVSLEASDRTSPAIAGARFMGPPAAVPIEPDDEIVFPVGDANPDGLTYAGPVWEVVGEVGNWPWGVEVQLRRET